MARSGILGNFSIRWNTEESRCVRWKGVITDMDEIAEMEERLELALELETLFNHAYESNGGVGFTDHEFWRQSSEIADSLWRRDYGWIEHTLRFIGGEEALVLSKRLKSYQQEREEKPKKREKRKYQQEER